MASILAPEAIESAIVRISSVDAARVVMVGDDVREIHIVANRSRPAKHIGRDVQSLLAARWGIECDQRTVSVVQLGSEVDLVHAEGEAPRRERRAKVEVGRITVTSAGDASSAKVEVIIGEKSVEGTADGSPSLLRRLVASATLDALQRLERAGPGELDGAVIARVGDQEVVVVSIAVIDAIARAGTAVIDARGELDAAARAVLSAYR